jgi:hypothetical protein
VKGAASLRAALAVTVTAVCLAQSARSAHADPPTKAECVSAHGEAQRLRRAGQLRETRAQLLVCANPSCPEPVTAECIPWLADVERALPTVVFEARLADGGDAIDVTVFVDGEKVEDKLDGRATAVNPGAHAIRFVPASGAATVERRVVVAEGEKTRVIRVDLPSAALLAPVPPPVVTESSHGPHWMTYVLGGVSVASLGGYAAFGLKGNAERNDLDPGGSEHCKPSCNATQTAATRNDYTAANVFLGVGIATAAAAIVVGLVTGLRSHPAPPPASASR